MAARARDGSTDPAPQAHWRGPVIAALITVALVSLVLFIGYERMRDDARSDAAASGKTSVASVKRAASGRAGARDERQRPAPGHGER